MMLHTHHGTSSEKNGMEKVVFVLLMAVVAVWSLHTSTEADEDREHMTVRDWADVATFIVSSAAIGVAAAIVVHAFGTTH